MMTDTVMHIDVIIPIVHSFLCCVLFVHVLYCGRFICVRYLYYFLYFFLFQFLFDVLLHLFI